MRNFFTAFLKNVCCKFGLLHCRFLLLAFQVYRNLQFQNVVFLNMRVSRKHQFSKIAFLSNTLSYS
jgi:hypothetical protein